MAGDRLRLLSAALVGAALVLAVLAQRQLEQPVPHLLPALVAFAVAAGLLGMVSYNRVFSLGSLQPRTLWLFLVSGLSLIVALYTHAQIPPATRWAVLAWLAGMAAFGAGCWERDREAGDVAPLRLDWTRDDTLICAAVVILAFLLRAIRLGSAPLTMSGDEGAMGLEALRVIGGQLTDPFATGWLSHPTLWFFLQSFSLRIFGDSLTGLRMLSVLVGSTTIATTYVLGRLLYSRRIAVVAVLLLASYHFHIHFSRLALNNIADPLWGTLVLTFLTVGLRTRRWLAFGLTGLALGLALYFYHGARLFVPLVVVLACLRVLPRLRRTPEWRGVLTSAWPAVVLAGILLAAGPLLQTFYAHPDAFTARVDIEGISWSWLVETASKTGRSQAQVLWDQFQRAALAFNTYPDRSDFYDMRQPLLGGLAAGLMVLGFLLMLPRLREWPYQVPVAWFVLAIIFGGMLLKAPPKSPRYVTLTPVVCLMMAFAIDHLVRVAQRLLPRWPVVPYAVAGMLVVYLGTVSVAGYFADYLRREELGSVNTHAANALADYLEEQPSGTQVWFLGAPRMYYHGFSLLDFLVRDVQAADIIGTIRSPAAVPDLVPGYPTVFAALPERKDELHHVQQRYPGGDFDALYWPLRSEPLMYVYRVSEHSGLE